MEKETKKTTTVAKKGTAKKQTTSAKKSTTKTSATKASTKTTTKKVTKKVEKPVTETKVEKKVTVEEVPVMEEVATKVTKKEAKFDIKEFFKSQIGLLIEIVLIILSVIAIFFFITKIVNNIKKDNEELITSGEIQYDQILVSNILNQSSSEYYVLIYDKSELYFNAYNTYLNIYKAKENALPVYTANLSSGFNKSYYAEESNVLVSNINDLKVKGSTLVRVQNGTVVSAYEGPESILEQLESM